MESSLNPKSDPKHGSFFTAHTWNTYNSHTKSLAWNRAPKPANTCCWGSTLLAFFTAAFLVVTISYKLKKLAMWESENAETKKKPYSASRGQKSGSSNWIPLEGSKGKPNIALIKSRVWWIRYTNYEHSPKLKPYEDTARHKKATTNEM